MLRGAGFLCIEVKKWGNVRQPQAKTINQKLASIFRKWDLDFQVEKHVRRLNHTDKDKNGGFEYGFC